MYDRWSFATLASCVSVCIENPAQDDNDRSIFLLTFMIISLHYSKWTYDLKELKQLSLLYTKVASLVGKKIFQRASVYCHEWIFLLPKYPRLLNTVCFILHGFSWGYVHLIVIFLSQLTQIYVQYSRHDCACCGYYGNTISALLDGNGLLVSQEYKQGHRLHYCSRKLLTNNSVVLKFNHKSDRLSK